MARATVKDGDIVAKKAASNGLADRMVAIRSLREWARRQTTVDGRRVVYVHEVTYGTPDGCARVVGTLRVVREGEWEGEWEGIAQ